MIEGQWFPGGKLWLAKVVLNIVMKPGWDELVSSEMYIYINTYDKNLDDPFCEAYCLSIL